MSELQSILAIKALSAEVEAIPLLSQINLELHPGEVMALVGPNGAGKSTLVKTIAGVQKHSNGEVLFKNKEIDQWHSQGESELLARQLAVLPQRSLLNFPFTAREVVELGRTPHDAGVEEDTRVVSEVLRCLDAGHLANRLYTNLSGGEQQRVQLARVLAQIWPAFCRSCCDMRSKGSLDVPDDCNECFGSSGKGRLLLLDEPSSYFDLAHQQMLVGLVRELARRGVAVLVVLHDLNLAMSCADKIAVLCCGRLEAVGDAKKVLNEERLQQVFGVTTRFIRDPETGHRHIVMVD